MAGKICYCFLPAKDKDTYTLCNNYRGKSYNVDHCSDCHGWSNELCEKVSAYCRKVGIQMVKEEGKVSLPLLFLVCHP